MADKTEISWCDSTINLFIGCTQISPACDNCYARNVSRRFGIKWNAPPVKTGEASWSKIAAYQRGAARFIARHGHPRRVFINSLSDFLDNQAEQSWRDKACIEMEHAPDVIFIIVTKRPQNAWKMFPAHWLKREGWPPNVWLIVTAENQQQYDLRVGHLLSIPGPAVAGVSIEPMLERLYHSKSISLSAHERAAWASRMTKKVVDPDTVNRLSWFIIGGESGRGARPMPKVGDICDFIRPLAAIKAAVFVKQMSQADHPDTFKDPATFPPGLRDRQHPVTTGASHD